MCKEITGLEMGTAGIIPEKWLKHGQKRNSGILRGLHLLLFHTFLFLLLDIIFFSSVGYALS